MHQGRMRTDLVPNDARLRDQPGPVRQPDPRLRADRAFRAEGPDRTLLRGAMAALDGPGLPERHVAEVGNLAIKTCRPSGMGGDGLPLTAAVEPLTQILAAPPRHHRLQ